MPGSSMVATGMPGNATASKERKTKNNAYLHDRAGRLQNLMVSEVESNSREGKKGRKRPDVFERMEGNPIFVPLSCLDIAQLRKY